MAGELIFWDQQKYFLRGPEEGKFEKFNKLNRRNLEKALPAYKNRIHQLSKKNKWSLKQELIALLRELEAEEK